MTRAWVPLICQWARVGKRMPYENHAYLDLESKKVVITIQLSEIYLVDSRAVIFMTFVFCQKIVKLDKEGSNDHYSPGQ